MVIFFSMFLEKFLLWKSMHNTKFAILTTQLCSEDYVSDVVQPSPLFIFRAFSSSQTEPLCPLSNNSQFPTFFL